MGVRARLREWWRSLGSTSVAASAADDAADVDAPEPSTEGGIAIVAIEEAIDLHHFAPRDIPSVVDEYLRAARRAGFHEVRVIHGKGKGVQRRRVQILLEEHPHVIASRSDGLGSTIATLSTRKSRKTPAR